MSRLRFPVLATAETAASVLSHEYRPSDSVSIYDLDKKKWLHFDAKQQLEPRVSWLRAQIAAQTKAPLTQVMLLTAAAQEGIPDSQVLDYVTFGQQAGKGGASLHVEARVEPRVCAEGSAHAREDAPRLTRTRGHALARTSECDFA
jgi:hypothetical protein